MRNCLMYRLGVLGVVLASAALPVRAQTAYVKYYPVGQLACSTTSESLTGSIELRNMRCDYLTSFGDRIATYTAQITRRSTTPVITSTSSLAWGVFTTRTSVSPGDLNGTYAVVSPSAKVVDYVSKLGLQNTSNLQAYLQPRSVVINNDLVNLAKTVKGIELRIGGH